MKRILTITIGLSLLLASCQPQSESLPTDLTELKALLKDKEAELKKLKDESDKINEKVVEIEEKIAEQEPPTEKSRKAVTTFIANSEIFKSYTDLQGNIESKDAVMISAEMGGRITSLNIEEGQYVNKGQQVGTVDMETIKTSIQEIETALQLATTVYERQQKLWDQQIGSEIQYLQAKNNKERLENSLATSKTQLSKENILSPMSGYVDMKFLKAGEMTAPGSPIASVINTSSVKAVIDVPENLVGSVKKGDKVVVSFPALGTEKSARVSLIGRSINSANRTFRVEINLSNPKGYLKPNLMVLTKINDETIKDAILLPVELVQQDVSGNSYVYIVAEGEDGPYAQKNIVKTGASYNGKIYIKSGLSAGDQIIDSGARGLAIDDLLEIINDSE